MKAGNGGREGMGEREQSLERQTSVKIGTKMSQKLIQIMRLDSAVPV